MLQAARQGGAGVLGSLLTHWQAHAPRQVILCECGQRMSSRGRRGKGLLTTLGPVPFARSFYQCEQCHDGRFPDDERLDIINTTYSPGVRRLMARAGSQTQFEQAAEDLLCYAGLKIESREIERVAEEVGRQVEQWVSEQQQQIALPGLSAPPKLEAGTKFYVSFDGTGVPVRKSEVIGRRGKQAMARLAHAKPNWAASLLRSAWTRRAILSAIPIRPPTSGRLSRALSLVGACMPKPCGAVWSKPRRLSC